MDIILNKINHAAFQLCSPPSVKTVVKTVENTSKQGKIVSIHHEELECHCFRSIHDVPNIWCDLPIEDYFLQKPYLACVETYPPKGMRFLYFVFYKNNAPVGFALGQIQHFNAYRSLNALQNPNQKETLNLKTKRFIARQINFHTLLIGNLLVTGEHSFYFAPQIQSQYNLGEILHEAVSKVLKSIPEEKVSVTIFKEYYNKNLPPLSYFDTKKYQQMSALPNMIVHIRPAWNSFDDYLKAMSSKYRTRAKRAFKKGKDIIKKELSLEEIEQYNEQIFSLYLQTASNADFNALSLHQEYFLGLKQYLKDRFQVFGYFLEGELIGFYTIIYNGKMMDAHFLGINNQYNHQYQVYLNMLYDLVRAGIDNQSQKIVMARTALEIKSSVGAEAHDMFAFVKFKNPLMNAGVRRLSSIFFQAPQWTPRTPFKD